MALGGLRDAFSGVPQCPICDGPCTHEFERGPYVFPDRLPQAKDGSADPPPVVPVKKRAKGRRAVHGPARTTARKLDEDRMVRPSEDR